MRGAWGFRATPELLNVTARDAFLQNSNTETKNLVERFNTDGSGTNTPANCGSRSSNWNNGPLNLNANNGARGVSDTGKFHVLKNPTRAESADVKNVHKKGVNMNELEETISINDLIYQIGEKEVSLFKKTKLINQLKKEVNILLKTNQELHKELSKYKE